MSIGGIPLASAFLFCIAFVAMLRAMAPRLGLVDAPTARKVHHGNVPVCGGLAMFVALLVALAIRHGLQPPGRAALTAGGSLEHSTLPLAVTLGMLVAIGVVDDRWGMGPLTKLALQVVAACLLLGLGRDTYASGGLLHLPVAMPGRDVIALVVTLLFIVGLINAFNMIDGLDGLAGGLAAVTLIGLAASGRLAGQASLVDDSLLLMAVVLGFLVFNLRRPGLRRAIAFMGDAGSMMLGCAIAAIIVELSSHTATVEGSLERFPSLLWLVAIPVIDTASLMIRRPLAGRSPMAADREHLHHLLLDAGLSPARTTVVLVGAAMVLATVGVAGWALQVPPVLMVAGLAVPALSHCALVWNCSQRRRGTAQALLISSEPAE
ncbi:MraY family glycosyltransferase [Kaistia defluvii]|uniref:MraY family glycosyltransferase n=1 Tax=Kaistia defluvii TaxID=410841 RepID=UPI002252836D|nr:MraY family glycosyltransferase [Kaistia defluvii]MCX5519511.1 MraY family glycosyltransferase [Kaistia defluvii]